MKVRSPVKTRARKALSGIDAITTSASTSAICAQPVHVIEGFPGSEFFGTDQGVEQVQAEADGHGQSDERLGHRRARLDSLKRRGVEPGERENANSEQYKA